MVAAGAVAHLQGERTWIVRQVAALAVLRLAIAEADIEDAGHLGEPENGYDESAAREEDLYDLPEGKVQHAR